MYLSAERLALANQAIQETFEQTCIAWQAIPHWDTGDRAQTKVPNGNPTKPDFVDLLPKHADLKVSLAEAIAPTPDALLAKVMAATVTLAADVDADLFPGLRAAPAAADIVTMDSKKPEKILDALIEARAKVEKAGYRAPSCLIAETEGIKDISQLASGYSVRQALLDAANVHSLQRVESIKHPTISPDKVEALFLGRRQLIAHGSASDASPGEEPVDIAVSVPPSLEVVGDTTDNNVELRIRIGYATRVKDVNGIVVIVNK
jgi:hypothetical protein